MAQLDWIVMLGTLFFIVAYGIWKTRKNKDIQSYLLGDKDMKWWTIGLSVMATQASAITFLATPGVAFEKGMGFVQFYFGLPIAMIIIAVFFIPLYYRLKVYTAYEYLESRFDNKTRILTATLFLIQRGLAAGITIYAPAIVLSTILGWNINLTNLFIGILVIAYTVTGGTRAVSVTHKQQMAVIFAGLIIAFVLLLSYIPVSFGEALSIAGTFEKMEVINLSFDPNDRYNIWSGLLGGLFLQLSYFGTDQSQVQRYLTGKSIKQSRLGLMFNGLVKIPMQFFILLIGVMVFVFYQFVQPPIFFNQAGLEQVKASQYAPDIAANEQAYTIIFEEKKQALEDLAAARKAGATAEIGAISKKVNELEQQGNDIRTNTKDLILLANPDAETKESNYVFINWVVNFLPVGIVGLLLAMIFSGAMSSTSAELNALASTMTVDVYKRNIKQQGSDKHYVLASKWFTVLWGVFALGFATLASMVENLVEAVNILGSIFYPVILGVFLVAFFLKWIKSNAVFIAAILSEILVISMYSFTDIGFLWYNVIGVGMVLVFAIILQFIFDNSIEKV